MFMVTVVTLPETNISPENGPGPQEGNESSSNHPFSGAFAVSFREGMSFSHASVS